jgi:adenylyltransferase and sulfurtransferase
MSLATPVIAHRTADSRGSAMPSGLVASSTKSQMGHSLEPAPSLASSRYNRQLLLPQLRIRGQELLLSSRVLVVGLGGLGSPAALYLSGAGVGTLGLMDGDDVELSNLHRQIVHTEEAARTKMSKVGSALARCRELNSEIKYICHEQRAVAANIMEIVAQYDLVLDCTDNPATRYLISDACVVQGKVLVSGAAQRGDGMLIVLNSPPTSSPPFEKGPCYRCVFPRPPAPDTVRGCSEIGVLGPVVGMIGTMMAGEAIKIISSGRHLPTSSSHVVSPQDEQPVKAQHTMLLYNTFASDPRSMFRTITLRGRRKDCLACGDDEALAAKGLSRITIEAVSQGRLDYQAFCGIEEDVKLLADECRIEAKEFLTKYVHDEAQQNTKKRKRNPIVVDVREEHEYELGVKVTGSVNIPISKILRNGGGAFDELAGLGTGPDGGMLDPESHIPVDEPTSQNAEITAERGMLNQEIHDPVTRGTTFSSADFPAKPAADVAPDGGMVNEETHTPVTRQTTFSSIDFPAMPGPAQAATADMLNQETHVDLTSQESVTRDDFPTKPVVDDQDNQSDSEALPVYFVCQRGNDSQIAAQKLKESIRAEEEAGGTRAKRKWGWIGDVKGGFAAMERYVAS